MALQVLPITRQSYRQAAFVLGKAFVDEPVSALIYRRFSPQQRVRALTVDFSAELLVNLRIGCPIQVEDDGSVAAAAIIYPPRTYPLPWYVGWIFLIKSVLRNGRYDIRSWIRWLNEVDKIHPTEPHYYLECIGVEPSYHRKGLGSLIMDHLITRADADRCGCYLENADHRNIPFYERFGFQIIDQKEIVGIPTWFMWRKSS